MPRIGDYDDWAIEWGYRRFYNYNSPEKEKLILINGRWKNYKTQDFGLVQKPILMIRVQSEQVGDNPMIAGKYGVKNLQES
jgi:hypothetical protein